MKINEKHSPKEGRHKSAAASSSRSSEVELAWSFDALANSRWSWRRTKDITARTSVNCRRSSRIRPKRCKSSTDTAPASEGSEATDSEYTSAPAPEDARNPPPERQVGLGADAPPTVQLGDAFPVGYGEASRADAHSPQSQPGRAHGPSPARLDLDLLNPSTWSRTNWAPEGTSLGAPVEYWPPQWSPSQWTGKRMEQQQPDPLPHPPQPQKPVASSYDQLVAGQDWDFLLEPLHD